MAVASVAERDRSASFDRSGIGLLAIAHVFNDANQSVLPAIIPWLIAHRGLTLTAAATLVLAMNVSSSIVQPLFGYLSDRRSLAWVIPVALLLATAGTAAIGFSPTMPLMLAGALVSGIGIAAFHPEASRFANYFGGARRATAMSWFTTGGYLGFAVGPIVVTPLLLAFGLHGTAFLLVPGAILAVLLARDLPRFERARSRAHGTGRHPGGRDDWRGFSILGVVVALRSTVFFAAVTFASVFAIAVTHVDKALGAVALAAMLLGGAFGTLWGGRLADRFDRRRVVTVSLAFAVAFGSAIALAGRFVPAFAVFVALGIGFGIALGLSAGVIVVMGQEYLPQRIGIASGLTLGLSVTIGGFAAPLFGAIGDRYGLVAVFAAAVIFGVLALGASLFLPQAHSMPGKPSRSSAA
ncbi:MAG TPA: MFS transporter [Candidatus Tumulicola sp.]|jgi:FSR family fosmidomycin resistance protein-like MFS transporter